MRQRVLSFGSRAVRLRWTGVAADRLVDFLFGSHSEETPNIPHVGLLLSSEEEKDHFSIRTGLISQEEEGKRWDRYGEGSAAIALMQQVTFHLADRLADGLLLHSACLSTQKGEAWLLAGPSGSGKSTLSVHLTQRGFSLLSDEMTCIDPTNLHCIGFARAVHLKGEAIRIFGEWKPLEGFQMQDENLGTLIAARQFSLRKQAALKGVLFPSYASGESLHVRRLSSGHTAMLLAKVAMNARNLPQNGFPDLISLARRRPAFQIRYGNLPQWDPLLQGMVDGSLLAE